MMNNSIHGNMKHETTTHLTEAMIKYQIGADYDFDMSDINLSIYGVCSECRKIE